MKITITGTMQDAFKVGHACPDCQTETACVSSDPQMICDPPQVWRAYKCPNCPFTGRLRFTDDYFNGQIIIEPMEK